MQTLKTKEIMKKVFGHYRHLKYAEIGESDRMTLKFVKPHLM